MVWWIVLWVITMPLLHARNSLAAGDVDFGRTLFMGGIFLIPAVGGALVSWVVLEYLAKNVFNQKGVTPNMAFFTWAVIFVFLFFLPYFTN